MIAEITKNYLFKLLKLPKNSKISILLFQHLKYQNLLKMDNFETLILLIAKFETLRWKIVILVISKNDQFLMKHPVVIANIQKAAV